MFTFFFKAVDRKFLYGEMALENYAKLWFLDRCLAVASFHLLAEMEMKNCFNWINLRPMYVRDNIFTGAKIDMRLYLLQEIQASYFMKINA